MDAVLADLAPVREVARDTLEEVRVTQQRRPYSAPVGDGGSGAHVYRAAGS